MKTNISIEEIAKYLADNVSAEFWELQPNVAEYHIYIRDKKLIPPHIADDDDIHLIADRDITEIDEAEVKDEAERHALFCESETLEDETFREVCEDFMEQIEQLDED